MSTTLGYLVVHNEVCDGSPLYTSLVEAERVANDLTEIYSAPYEVIAVARVDMPQRLSDDELRKLSDVAPLDSPWTVEDRLRLLAELRALRLLAELRALRQERDAFKGSMDAQDEREMVAGERCGVDWTLHGCDWPEAVADEVAALRAEAATADRELVAQAKQVNQFKAEREELQATLDLMWDASQRGAKRWQDANGYQLTFPDRADLVAWLCEQLDEARRNLEHQALATEKGRELVGPWIKEVQQLKRERDALAAWRKQVEEDGEPDYQAVCKERDDLHVELLETGEAHERIVARISQERDALEKKLYAAERCILAFESFQADPPAEGWQWRWFEVRDAVAAYRKEHKSEDTP